MKKIIIKKLVHHYFTGRLEEVYIKHNLLQLCQENKKFHDV